MPPLVTIRFDRPDVQYAGALRQAVAAARARKADVRFDVVGLVAPGASVAQDTAGLEAATARARAVAHDIVSSGVPADRVRLEARTEPGLGAPEVRVFVQ